MFYVDFKFIGLFARVLNYFPTPLIPSVNRLQIAILYENVEAILNDKCFLQLNTRLNISGVSMTGDVLIDRHSKIRRLVAGEN